jgi:hypothetical protein
MSFHARLVAVQDTALNIVRVWWRPMICAEFAITVGVNMIYLPLKTGHSIEFAPAAAFVTAIVAGFAVRTYEKINAAE